MCEARPEAEWHEDIGPVLWWRFPIDEPPYVGTPLDLGYPVEIRVGMNGEDHVQRYLVGGWPGYHTHSTPIIAPNVPTPTKGRAND